MSCQWICFSLLCAATHLKSSASASNGVSLKCNDMVEAVAGETVSLSCNISFSLEQNCTGISYLWTNTSSDRTCNGDWSYTCEWDRRTYVLLNISKVEQPEETYRIQIQTDCGEAQSSVTVRVQQPHTYPKKGDLGEANTHVTHAVLGVFATLIVFGILVFLFLSKRVRNVFKCTKEGTQEEPNMDPAQQSTLMDEC